MSCAVAGGSDDAARGGVPGSGGISDEHRGHFGIDKHVSRPLAEDEALETNGPLDATVGTAKRQHGSRKGLVIDGGIGTDSAQIDTGVDTTVNVESFLP